MPLILESHDSLPYIDQEPTPAERTAAESLLERELPPSTTEQPRALHPSIPNISYTPAYSQLLSTAHAHIAETSKPRPADAGIDMSRYEEPSAPDIASSPSHDEWRRTLRQAYASHAYLTSRTINLSLLEKYGKNAWLIGNSQVEAEVAAVERELETARRELEGVERERRDMQEARRGEVEGLEEGWRDGLGRAIRAEVAAEGLRRQVLESKRTGGGAG